MDRPNRCHCVFPSATEECLGTYEGDTPGTAFRVLVEAGRDGYVRLQQLSYAGSMGWYVQKSMVIPGEMIRPIVSALRKADCLIPRPATAGGPLKLVHPEDESSPMPVTEQKSA